MAEIDFQSLKGKPPVLGDATQRPVSVCRRAEVIIAHAPSTLFPYEMHEFIVEKSVPV
jgi:hypothetical protein